MGVSVLWKNGDRIDGAGSKSVSMGDVTLARSSSLYAVNGQNTFPSSGLDSESQ